MPVRTVLLFLMLAALSGCASSADPSAGEAMETHRPVVQVQLEGPIYFGSGTTAQVSMGVHIANPTSETVVVRRVRIEAPGMSYYQLYPSTREFRETLNSGQQWSVSMSARAVTNIARLNPNEPLTLRVTLEYETPDAKRHRAIYTTVATE